MSVTIRYIVHDVQQAVDFYTEKLGFEVIMHPGKGFALLSKDELNLGLSWVEGDGGGSQGSAPNERPQPGGWNRFQIRVSDLTSMVNDLREQGATFRNEIVSGKGGKQILLEDPSHNLIELFEPFER